MTIDKSYWINFHFRDNELPEIICPTCKKGKLKIKDSFQSHPIKGSIELFQLDFNKYDDTDYEEKFSGFLVCLNDTCKEIITVVGSRGMAPDEPEVEIDEYGECYLSPSWYIHYSPEFFTPPLEIFSLKKEYPKDVIEVLKKSFSLYFVDIESCANKIRTAIETLLDELGVNRTFINARGRRESYKLHKRIEIYKITNNEIGELMLSTKWIGNFGSHSESLKREDLIDAYIFMQTILDKLYDDKMKNIMKLAKTINKTKKPPSKIKMKKSR